ncbi:MAG: hypothetical protein ACREIM_10715, partial [Nitrospiraceae bacterium]
FMNASAAIVDSLVRQACVQSSSTQASGLAAQSLDVLFQVRLSLSRLPRARLPTRLHDFATNRHE